MSCKKKISSDSKKALKKIGSNSNSDNSSSRVSNSNSKLNYLGREQFFWHYPFSQLPIRDITEKTEPHIEIGAENYLRACYQPSIRGFCNSQEQYLFLCTTCNNSVVEEGKFLGKRFIVGYIRKDNIIRTNNHMTVIGKSYIVPFKKELEYSPLKIRRGRAMKRIKTNQVKEILKIIHSNNDITSICISEMIEKEKEAKKIKGSLPIESECLKEKCEFRSNCLRRNLK